MRTILTKSRSVVIALALLSVVACSRNEPRSVADTSAAQSHGSSSPATQVPPQKRILTKDPEYMSLLKRLANPPSGEALLEYSDTYKTKKAEIDAKLAAITDSGLRGSASDEEWAKVDKDALEREAEPKARTEIVQALEACLSRHGNDWFEIGHPSYSSQNNVSVTRVAASPIEWDSSMSVPVDVQTMDRVYSGFRDTTKQQTDEMIQQWVYAQSCSVRRAKLCQQFHGDCSSYAGIEQAMRILENNGFRTDNCDDNPPQDRGRAEVEATMRGQRLILVGQGDLIAHRIDQLMIVDYDTETIYLKLDPKVLAGTDLRWRFSSLPDVDTERSGLSQPVGDRPDQLNNPATPGQN